eukprot:TRINITY_DN76_c5_g1_i1.p1 TRINITY_DN76_c5_g1~~TRINITY_DN76_c5_g1_i1.p1  ORF type:complete len:342 (-),score=85.58 TRINITY_DN76_c5_g1_i1:79-1104(-)
MQMENIASFIRACEVIGLKETNIFETGDLFNEKNMVLVVQTIHALGNLIKSYKTSSSSSTGSAAGSVASPSVSRLGRISAGSKRGSVDGHAAVPEGVSLHLPDIEKSLKDKSLFSASLMDGSLNFENDHSLPPSSPLSDSEVEILDWVNAQFEKAAVLASSMPQKPIRTSTDGAGSIVKIGPVTNLSYAFKSGVRLVRLMEILTKHSSIGPDNKNPKTLWKCMQNASLVIRFISAQTFEQVRVCSASDIVAGNTPRIVSLLQLLRDKYDLEHLFEKLLQGDDGDEEDINLDELSDEALLGLLENEEEEEEEEELAVIDGRSEGRREGMSEGVSEGVSEGGG